MSRLLFGLILLTTGLSMTFSLAAPVTQADIDAAFAPARALVSDVVDQAATAEAALSKAQQQIAADKVTIETDAAHMLQLQTDLATRNALVDKLRSIVPGPSVSLTATPTTIKLGESSTLSLSATYTETCTATGWDILNPIVLPNTTTTYQVACTGWNGTSVSTETAVAVVQPPPEPTLNISLDPLPPIDAGKQITVTWQSNLDKCVANGGWSGEFAASGTQSIAPGATIQIGLDCSAVDGRKISKTVDVEVHQTQPPPIVEYHQHVTLAFADGKTIEFDSADATDRGTYDGPFIHQRNLCQGRAAWMVCFRPDVDGKRDEVVVEYGTLFDFSAKPPKPASGVVPANSGPYTATISGGNLSVPIEVAVPRHWWMARLRWQSASRPVVRGLAELVAMRATMPLDKTLAYGASVPGGIAWQGPMGTGPLLTGMGATGDRYDVGPANGWMVDDLVFSRPSSEAAWRAAAEATGTMAFWVRDAATGAPVDLSARPLIAFNDANNGPYRVPRPTAPTGASNWFSLDEAHMPETAFLAWLRTDDPYFLEGAQATANYGLLENNINRINEKLPMMVNVSQPRTFAWFMRDWMHMAAFSPESPPSWLLPRSYWHKGMADSLTFSMKYVNATASPATRVFGLMTLTGSFQSFMTDYIARVLAEMQWQGGFPEWAPVVEYAARPRMALSDHTGASGWDARFPTPYNVPVVNARLGALAKPTNAGNYALPFSPDTPESWAELWQDFKLFAAAGGQALWTDPSTWSPDQLHPIAPTYLPQARGTLAALALAGVPGAKERHDWLRTRMDKQYPVMSGAILKWATPAQ